MADKPRFRHDCDVCEFQGRHGQYDVYFCSQGDWRAWIARRSSEVSDYSLFLSLSAILRFLKRGAK